MMISNMTGRRVCLWFALVMILVILIGLYYIMHDFVFLNESLTCKSHQPQPIPRHIHFIWINFNKDSYMSEEETTNMKSCIRLNPGYTVSIWNETQAELLIATHYPMFLHTYQSYAYPIQKHDAARYFILYHLGGVYLDFDITCVVSFDTIIKNSSMELPGSDMVAAQEDSRFVTGFSGLLNSFMATPPKHPFMLEVISNLHASNRFFLSRPHTISLSVGAWYFARLYAKYPCKEHIRPLGSNLAYQNGVFMRHKFSERWRQGDIQSLILRCLWQWLIQPAVKITTIILFVWGIVYVKENVLHIKKYTLRKYIKAGLNTRPV